MPGISKPALERLPLYLSYLKNIQPDGAPYISAASIAGALGLKDVLVRKDLACVSASGKPKKGYVRSELIGQIERFLGYNDTRDAVIAGAGKLGKALLEYDGFKEYGLNIIAAFDCDPRVIGTADNGKAVFPISRLKEICLRMNILIGVITVPRACAQQVCSLMVESGILAVWNFTSAHLIAPSGVLIQNENMASSLAALSRRLSGGSEA